MIEFGWGDYEETYIVILFKKYWTVEDYLLMVVANYSKLAKLDRNVNFIVDLRYSATPPSSIFSTISRSMKQRPDNTGRVVVVSRTKIWKRIFNTIANTPRDRAIDIHFVNTMDEAYPLILSVTAGS